MKLFVFIPILVSLSGCSSLGLQEKKVVDATWFAQGHDASPEEFEKTLMLGTSGEVAFSVMPLVPSYLKKKQGPQKGAIQTKEMKNSTRKLLCFRVHIRSHRGQDVADFRNWRWSASLSETQVELVNVPPLNNPSYHMVNTESSTNLIPVWGMTNFPAQSYYTNSQLICAHTEHSTELIGWKLPLTLTATLSKQLGGSVVKFQWLNGQRDR